MSSRSPHDLGSGSDFSLEKEDGVVLAVDPQCRKCPRSQRWHLALELFALGDKRLDTSPDTNQNLHSALGVFGDGERVRTHLGHERD